MNYMQYWPDSTSDNKLLKQKYLPILKYVPIRIFNPHYDIVGKKLFEIIVWCLEIMVKSD